MQQHVIMDIDQHWRFEYLHGIEAWLRDMTSHASLAQRFSLAVWKDGAGSEWEWEVFESSTDYHLAGAATFTRESAMQEAVAVATLFGLK
jgi:hypothetical protein